MIAGVGGGLLPGAFIEQRVADLLERPETARFQCDLRRWCVNARILGPAAALRAMVDAGGLPLVSLLGLTPEVVELRDDHVVASCRAGRERILLLTCSWGKPLAPWWRCAVTQSAHTNSPWCLVFNGTHLGLFCPSRLHSRRFVAIELDAAADERSTAAALLMICGANALGLPGTSPASLTQLLADADLHAIGVCRSLREGVLDGSQHILRALAKRERTRPIVETFEQSLTIVYRLVFLLFAEARGLVPLWHPVYRDSYSIEALRQASLDPRAVGLWDALRATSRLAHAGCRAGALQVTAFNGRLFSPSRTPLAERRGLDDEAARRAIVALSTREAPDREGREPISFRDLGVEELGAVYEALLDYAPQVGPAGRGRAPEVSLRPGAGIRKDTGTFYTPQSIVDHLVRDTLTPLTAGATPEQILALRILDPAMGSGAFLVGACRFLTEAYERALIAHGRCLAADIGNPQRASIRRLVAERCLYGVDLNPFAVQLARLSLWLTTLAADKPLTFLDHRLRVGNSLAGAWLSLLRTSPRRRDGAVALPLFPDEAPATAIREALPVRFRLAAEPNDTAAQVRAKERALATLTSADAPLATWARVASLWCCAWLADPPVPGAAYTALVDAILSGQSSLPMAKTREFLQRVDAAAESRRLFHWELEFPEVFFDDGGNRAADAGFDAVIGNPPWDMVRDDTHGDRADARAEAEMLVRFARQSGVYHASTGGHVNRYQLFAERAVALTRPGGRIGLVLPSGLLTDSGSASLRRLLFARCAVERIIGFDNRNATFPIHRSVRFVLLSARAGQATGETACRFGEADPSILDRAVAEDGRPDPAWFPIRLTMPLLAKLSGSDLTVPDFRTPDDLRIAERAAQMFAPLGSSEGWNAHFGRELNATDDRDLLHTDGRGLPVLEGKLIEPFRVSASRARWSISLEEAERAIGGRVHRPRLAYRDVASATNRVTLIAAILPPGTASTHTLLCLKEPLPLRSQRLLCALMNSLVVNFLVRLRVTTHVTTVLVERLPIPTETEIGPACELLCAAAQSLASGESRAAAASLNAAAARIYRLTDQELEHVLGRFPLVHAADRSAMLREFRRL